MFVEKEMRVEGEKKSRGDKGVGGGKRRRGGGCKGMGNFTRTCSKYPFL